MANIKNPKGGHNSLLAFTLAEVLITLAIIGVVAALTIPTLIANYNKKQYVTQLKKNYTNLTNGFHDAMAREGVFRLQDTTLLHSINGYYTSTSNASQSAFATEFSKIFSVVKWANNGQGDYEKNIIQPLFMDGSKYLLYFDGHMEFDLSDGSVILLHMKKNPNQKDASTIETIKAKGGNLLSYAGAFYVDVNGIKKPNMVGRDFFSFVIGDDGSVYPQYGKDYALLQEPNKDISDPNASFYWKNNGSSGRCDKQYYGLGCAAKIMEDGWIMDY